MSKIYDNAFAAENVYGRALQLIADHAALEPSAVHLDVGCGYAALAPHIRDLGLTYVGVDIDAESVEAVSGRGFEAHVVELADQEATFERLSKAVAGRRLSSVSILDTLEHVLSPLEVMRALRRLIEAPAVPLILSVPNVTHVQVVAKMVTGRFDYTVDGILDHTHIINFSEDTLNRMTRQAGLVEIARNDTVYRYPDRDFHLDPDELGPEASYFAMIGRLREMASDTAISYQFVRAFQAAPARDAENWFVNPAARPKRPFLSIVVRTTGTERFTLRDTLNCLTGQSVEDFEVVLVGHRLDADRQVEVEKVIEDLPPLMKEKLRFIRVEDGNRTKPLNVGYANAKGRYIVTLDDDDLVFGHYVETFKDLAEQYRGRLLRARCGMQKARVTRVDGGPPAGISTGPVVAYYPARFSLVDHLFDNHTPCMSVAYPREAFHVLGLRFDETLSTAEDYDFMMRAYFLFGVAESTEITSIYRQWHGRRTSTVLHAQDEWRHNHARIVAKLDSATAILPPGALAEIRLRAVAPGHVKLKRTLAQKIAREWSRFKKRRLKLS